MSAVRVECTCEICTANAGRLGLKVLAAEITDDGVRRLGGKLTKQAIHGVVHAVNHPQIGRALVKHRSAYWAA